MLIHNLPTNRSVILLFLLLELHSPGKLLAQLSWTETQKSINAEVNDVSAVVRFEFQNVGNHPVTILDVKPSCGCTTVELAKKRYLVGEKGEISATLTFGDRVGFQQKFVMVKTDSEEAPLQQLTLKAYIPEILKAMPRGVSWGVGSPGTSQTVVLSVGNGFPVKVLGVQSSDDRLFAKLKLGKNGSYEVAVTPASTLEPLRATIRVETNYPSEKPKVFFIPVEIGSVSSVQGAGSGNIGVSSSEQPKSRIIAPVIGQ